MAAGVVKPPRPPTKIRTHCRGLKPSSGGNTLKLNKSLSTVWAALTKTAALCLFEKRDQFPSLAWICCGSQEINWLKWLRHVDMVFEDKLHWANYHLKRQQNNSWRLTDLDNRRLSALEISELSSRLFHPAVIIFLLLKFWSCEAVSCVLKQPPRSWVFRGQN